MHLHQSDFVAAMCRLPQEGQKKIREQLWFLYTAFHLYVFYLGMKFAVESVWFCRYHPDKGQTHGQGDYDTPYPHEKNSK